MTGRLRFSPCGHFLSSWHSSWLLPEQVIQGSKVVCAMPLLHLVLEFRNLYSHCILFITQGQLWFQVGGEFIRSWESGDENSFLILLATTEPEIKELNCMKVWTLHQENIVELGGDYMLNAGEVRWPWRWVNNHIQRVVINWLILCIRASINRSVLFEQSFSV